MDTDIARAWVDGWVLSRGAEKPVPEPWGLRIEVGVPNQLRRHVLLDADDATVRDLAASVADPTTWIKAFVEPELLEAMLTPEWEPDSPGFLMTTGLSLYDLSLAPGYRLETETSAGVTRARILAGDGTVAARGQVAVTGPTCVFDQIVTEPAHQRRRLGTAVMAALSATALHQGATTGILGATTQGRALYESLGWRVDAPLSGFIYKPLEH